MRLRRLWPLVALLAVGCDPRLVQVLGEVASPMAGEAGAVGPATPAAPSPSPARESFSALDLSGETWVSEQPDTYRVEADRIVVPARKAIAAHLFYRPALGDTFTLRFTEPRERVNGDLTVWWMLDRADSLRTDAEGNKVPNGEHKLTLHADGRCVLRAGGRTRAEQTLAGPRRWAIAVRPGHTTVTVNDAPFADYDHVAGYHPAPFLAFTTLLRKQVETALEAVSVETSAPGPRHAVIRQWSMSGRGVGIERFNLIYPADLPQLPAPAELDTYPALLPHVVALGGYPLYRTEGLTFARTDRFGGGTHGAAGVMLSPALIRAGALPAHELAHGYQAAGSQKARSGEGWLVEGFADYLGHQAYHRYRGLPVWKTPAIGKLPAYDPPLAEPHAATVARDGANAIGWKVYTKGRIFFALLAAHTSPEDVRATVVAAKGVDKLTGERFVQLLEARTGKDLAALRPGWLTAGPYQAASPRDAVDTDKDGLLDFQELAWGTDPTRKDTDADGVSDFDERARGTAPRVADASPAGLAGFAPGGPSGALPDAEAEPAPAPEEAEPAEEP